MNQLKMAEKIVSFCSPRFRKTLKEVRRSCSQYGFHCYWLKYYYEVEKDHTSALTERGKTYHKIELTLLSEKLRDMVEYEFRRNPFRGQLLCDLINQELNNDKNTMHRIRIKES